MARTIGSIENYIATVADGELYMHLYIGYEGAYRLDGGDFAVNQSVNFGETCRVSIEIDGPEGAFAVFNFKMPDRAGDCELRVNGNKIDALVVKNGYIKIAKNWSGGEKVEINFAMPVLQIAAHPKVWANTDKVAVQYGPFVYCLEEADNGTDLHLINIARCGRDDGLGGQRMKRFFNPHIRRLP